MCIHIYIYIYSIYLQTLEAPFLRQPQGLEVSVLSWVYLQIAAAHLQESHWIHGCWFSAAKMAAFSGSISQFSDVSGWTYKLMVKYWFIWLWWLNLCFADGKQIDWFLSCIAIGYWRWKTWHGCSTNHPGVPETCKMRASVLGSYRNTTPGK